MAIKKFTAQSAHQAMQEVREAFGRDAIIISNKTTDEGIEILATDNTDDLQPEAQSVVSADSDAPARTTGKGKRKKSTATGGGKSRAAGQPADAEAPSAVDFEREALLRQEIADLQGAVQGLTTSGGVSAGAHWAEITLTGRLMGLGLGSSLVQQLIGQIKPISKVDPAWKLCLKNIRKQIRFSPGEFCSEGGVYVFHGPAGAGKTTAVCKLAAQFLNDNTVGKLAIVSAGSNTSLERKDGLLTAFGHLLGIPVYHVEEPTDLREALNSLRRKKLVLVDTPAFDVNRLLPFSDSIAQPRSKKKIEHCLVVSACTQGSLLDHTFACLGESTIESVVLTNVDQTRQIGTAIDSLLRSGLPLRYCSDSPNLHSPLQNDATNVLMDQLAEVNPLNRASSNAKMPAQIDSGSVANWLESAILA